LVDELSAFSGELLQPTTQMLDEDALVLVVAGVVATGTGELQLVRKTTKQSKKAREAMGRNRSLNMSRQTGAAR